MNVRMLEAVALGLCGGVFIDRDSNSMTRGVARRIDENVFSREKQTLSQLREVGDELIVSSPTQRITERELEDAGMVSLVHQRSMMSSRAYSDHSGHPTKFKKRERKSR